MEHTVYSSSESSENTLYILNFPFFRPKTDRTRHAWIVTRIVMMGGSLNVRPTQDPSSRAWIGRIGPRGTPRRSVCLAENYLVQDLVADSQSTSS